MARCLPTPGLAAARTLPISSTIARDEQAGPAAESCHQTSASNPTDPTIQGAVIATIDDLLSKVDSKYTLVHLAAQRAREINDYYHSLGEGLGQYTPPLVEQVDSNKPLSIALEEIAAEKIVPQYPGDARRVAEELLGGGDGGTEAEIYTLTDTAIDDLGSLDSEPIDSTPAVSEPVDALPPAESTTDED